MLILSNTAIVGPYRQGWEITKVLREVGCCRCFPFKKNSRNGLPRQPIETAGLLLRQG
jgi:hypothetical protein